MIYLNEAFTKQDAQRIFREVIDDFEDCWDLDAVFDASKIDKKLYFLNSNNRKVLGLCKQFPYKHYYTDDPKYDPDLYDDDDYFIDYRYQIYLNPNCLNFEEDRVQIMKETFAHELCHTLPDCMNHGPNFHKWGNLIYNRLGYKIDTTADVDASNYFRELLPEHPYRLQCFDCGKVMYQDRLSDYVKNPGRYKCSCGGNLYSYKLNNKTGSYDLYKEPDSELDYKYFAKCAQSDCDFFEPFKTKSKQFKDLEKALEYGHELECPRCHRNSIYLSDNGNIISTNVFGRLYDR
jgi:predicted SprT family Zn-dependent metalloprotease